MGDFEFEFEPLREGGVEGYRGVAGPFGSVEVATVPSAPGQGPSRQVALDGARFPEALFSGGAGVLPSLDGGWLRVDGTVLDMDVKIKGIRKGSRWLELALRDRRYIYTATSGFGDAQLSGDGIMIATSRGRPVPMTFGSRIVRVEGYADPTDLAIALVLEQVDRPPCPSAAPCSPLP